MKRVNHGKHSTKIIRILAHNIFRMILGFEGGSTIKLMFATTKHFVVFTLCGAIHKVYHFFGQTMTTFYGYDNLLKALNS